MPLFNNFFKKKPAKAYGDSPASNFGRYMSCNKPISTKKKFDEAKKLFINEDYISSFEKLLDFLNNEPRDNVEYFTGDGNINFSLIQGSCKISGKLNLSEFEAYSSLGNYEESNAALLRHLLSKNLSLQYSAFAIRNNDIIIKTNFKTKESSPEKLYFTLKELSLSADAEAANLENEFSFAQINSDKSYTDISESELKTKIKYLKIWISNTLEYINSLKQFSSYESIASYSLLALIFRIDFLLIPVGKVRSMVDKAVSIYNQKNMTLAHKLKLVLSMLKETAELSEKDLQNSFKKHTYTFGIIEASSHKQVYEFILSQLKKTEKLKFENQGQKIAFYEYISGYCMYFFGVFTVTKELIVLIYKIICPDFFNDIGYSATDYFIDNKKLNREKIEKEIGEIIEAGRHEYPKLSIMLSNLSYNNTSSFIYSLLNEITYLNYSQPK